MVRLTPELIARSPQFLNCIGEREIDLRGNNIPAVENLATTRDQLDVIDLSHNAIVSLDNFPPLRRVKIVQASFNHITRLGATLHTSLPNLQSLLLVGNRLGALSDLEELTKLRHLERLSLVDNPVATQPNYRAYLIYKIATLKLLDYHKVTVTEREQAQMLFSGAGGAKLRRKIESAPKTFAVGELGEPAPAVGAGDPTAQQIDEVKTAIRNATTIEEVEQLEKVKRQG